MSLVSAPFGMRSAYHPSGVAVRVEQGTITATSPFIHDGDPVAIAADGSIIRATPGAGNKIVGVFAGCEYRDGTGKPNVSRCWPSNPSAFDIKCYYTADPELVYEIQANGPVTRDMIGSQATWGAPGSVNIMTGGSASYLDVATISNSIENQLAIVGLREYPDNVWGDAYTTVLVKIAQHQRAAAFDAF